MCSSGIAGRMRAWRPPGAEPPGSVNEAPLGLSRCAEEKLCKWSVWFQPHLGVQKESRTKRGLQENVQATERLSA